MGPHIGVDLPMYGAKTFQSGLQSEMCFSDGQISKNCVTHPFYKNRALTHTLYKYASSIPTAEISGQSHICEPMSGPSPVIFVGLH